MAAPPSNAAEVLSQRSASSHAASSVPCALRAICTSPAASPEYETTMGGTTAAASALNVVTGRTTMSLVKLSRMSDQMARRLVPFEPKTRPFPVLSAISANASPICSPVDETRNATAGENARRNSLPSHAAATGKVADAGVAASAVTRLILTCPSYPATR